MWILGWAWLLFLSITRIIEKGVRENITYEVETG